MMANGKSCVKCGQYWSSHLDSNGECCSCKIHRLQAELEQEKKENKRIAYIVKKFNNRTIPELQAETQKQAEEIARLRGEKEYMLQFMTEQGLYPEVYSNWLEQDKRIMNYIRQTLKGEPEQ